MKLMGPIEEPKNAPLSKLSKEDGKQIEANLRQRANVSYPILLRRESGTNVIDLRPQKRILRSLEHSLGSQLMVSSNNLETNFSRFPSHKMEFPLKQG